MNVPSNTVWWGTTRDLTGIPLEELWTLNELYSWCKLPENSVIATKWPYSSFVRVMEFELWFSKPYMLAMFGDRQILYRQITFMKLFVATTLRLAPQFAVLRHLDSLQSQSLLLGNEYTSTMETSRKNIKEHATGYQGYEVEGDYRKNSDSANTDSTHSVKDFRLNKMEQFYMLNNQGLRIRYQEIYNEYNNLFVEFYEI